MGLPTTEEEQQQKLMAEMMMKQGANSADAQLPYDKALFGRKDGGTGPKAPFSM